MFAARGLVVRRGNGETITPYYFAYEDLKQDWDSLLAKGVNVPTQPPVEVCDFTEVMCLSRGITKESVQDPSKEREVGTERDAEAKNGESSAGATGRFEGNDTEQV